MDHRRDVVLDHLLVDRVPVAVGQRRSRPVAARRIGVEVEATAPYSSTHLASSGMQVAGATPGSAATRRRQKWSGNRRLTREHSSLQIAAQVVDTSKSPMWWAMKLARGQKMVRSDPRASSARAGYSRSSRGSRRRRCEAPRRGHGRRIRDAGDLAVAPRLQRLGRGGVVAVEVDDHAASHLGRRSRAAGRRSSRRRCAPRVRSETGSRVRHPGASRRSGRRRETGHERGEPPREALGPPDAAQAALGVGVEAGVAAFAVVLDERAARELHVGGRQVQALGAGRRHDVARIAGQEQPAEAHRFGDEAAQRRDALLDRRPGHQRFAAPGVEAQPQLVPERLVRPVFDLFGRAAPAGSSGSASGCASSRGRSRAGC